MPLCPHCQANLPTPEVATPEALITCPACQQPISIGELSSATPPPHDEADDFDFEFDLTDSDASDGDASEPIDADAWEPEIGAADEIDPDAPLAPPEEVPPTTPESAAFEMEQTEPAAAVATVADTVTKKAGIASSLLNVGKLLGVVMLLLTLAQFVIWYAVGIDPVGLAASLPEPLDRIAPARLRPSTAAKPIIYDSEIRGGDDEEFDDEDFDDEEEPASDGGVGLATDDTDAAGDPEGDMADAAVAGDNDVSVTGADDPGDPGMSLEGGGLADDIEADDPADVAALDEPIPADTNPQLAGSPPPADAGSPGLGAPEETGLAPLENDGTATAAVEGDGGGMDDLLGAFGDAPAEDADAGDLLGAIDPPVVEPESPFAAGGPTGMSTYSSAELSSGVTRAQATHQAFNQAYLTEAADTRQKAAAFYVAWCEMAEKAVLVSRDEAENDLARCRDLMTEMVKEPAKQPLLARWAIGWMSPKQRAKNPDRTPGVVLTGEVERVMPAGDYYQFRLRMLDRARTPIDVVTRMHPEENDLLDVIPGARVLVLGAEVAEPAERLPGYTGDASRVLFTTDVMVALP